MNADEKLVDFGNRIGLTREDVEHLRALMLLAVAEANAAKGAKGGKAAAEKMTPEARASKAARKRWADNHPG